MNYWSEMPPEAAQRKQPVIALACSPSLDIVRRQEKLEGKSRGV